MLTAAIVIGIVLSIILLIRFVFLIGKDFRARRQAERSGQSKWTFLAKMETGGVSVVVAEFLWSHFRRWMIINYPLLVSDIVDDIIRLDGREGLDILSEEIMHRFGHQIEIPTEYGERSLFDLGLFLTSKIDSV